MQRYRHLNSHALSDSLTIVHSLLFSHHYLTHNTTHTHQLTISFTHSSDVDECATGRDDCSLNAVCINTDGSFLCQCRPGFEGDGRVCRGKYSKNNKLQKL